MVYGRECRLPACNDVYCIVLYSPIGAAWCCHDASDKSLRDGIFVPHPLPASLLPTPPLRPSHKFVPSRPPLLPPPIPTTTAPPLPSASHSEQLRHGLRGRRRRRRHAGPGTRVPAPGAAGDGPAAAAPRRARARPLLARQQRLRHGRQR